MMMMMMMMMMMTMIINIYFFNSCRTEPKFTAQAHLGAGVHENVLVASMLLLWLNELRLGCEPSVLGRISI
jgi:hypothetical protein